MKSYSPRVSSWQIKDITLTILRWLMLLCMGYAGIAFVVFQYRNPTANKMSFYRDFVSVMCFEKLSCYQTEK